MKLNLGGGLQKIPGFVNVDRQLGQEAFPLPDYADGSVDEIRASHILEHFGHREVPEVLKEWVRVLKPGGEIRIAVPDLDWLIQHRESDQPIESYLMGGQTNDDDFHRSVYTERKLRDLMRYVGLTDITRWTSEIQDCASLPVSLNLKGVKPANVRQVDANKIEVNARVAAIMSVPRLGWNDHWGAVWQALRTPEFNIPIWRYGGAFWEQGMQNGLKDLRDKGTEWAITLDYDTLFDSEDIKHLLTLAAQYPEADAIVPIQVRRNNEQFLFTMRDEYGNLRHNASLDELSDDLTPISTGHFGMTLIKLRCLDDIPKPWLWSQPDANGDWSNDRTDADIYFWNKLKAAGRKVYQANHIKIGHLQVVGTWPTNDWRIKHQYVSEWTEKGKPDECKRPDQVD